MAMRLHAQVWRWREGVVAMQLYQKTFSRDAWPSVAFTADEGRALHAVTNAVNIYKPATFSAGALPLLYTGCSCSHHRTEAMHA